MAGRVDSHPDIQATVHEIREESHLTLKFCTGSNHEDGWGNYRKSQHDSDGPHGYGSVLRAVGAALDNCLVNCRGCNAFCAHGYSLRTEIHTLDIMDRILDVREFAEWERLTSVRYLLDRLTRFRYGGFTEDDFSSKTNEEYISVLSDKDPLKTEFQELISLASGILAQREAETPVPQDQYGRTDELIFSCGQMIFGRMKYILVKNGLLLIE